MDNLLRLHNLGYSAGSWDATYQQIDAVVDGQTVHLSAPSLGVLALGDYPAKVSEKVHGPHNSNSYDLYKGYDLLMPDGKLRTFQVTGIGAASPRGRIRGFRGTIESVCVLSSQSRCLLPA